MTTSHNQKTASVPIGHSKSQLPGRSELLELTASPTTSPKELAAMAKNGDREINALIAANPNTPKNTLLELWLAHPLCALENPILLYWSLREGKDTHSLLPMTVKLALYLEFRKTEDLHALESHLPEAERQKWLGEPSADAQRTGNAWTSAPPQRDTPSRVIPRGYESAGAAGVYGILATDPSQTVRKALAGALDSIPFDSRERSKIQRILILDESPKVRSTLACSRCINEKLHLQLANDPDFNVRNSLAGNSKIFGPQYLEGWNRLIAAGHAEAVAANQACPESIKITLISNGSVTQRKSAWAGLRFHETSDWKTVSNALESVLSDSERLAELVQIAKNQTIGGTLKSRLTTHPDVRVTRALATQSHLTEQQRLKLLFHRDQKTALRAAKHAPPADFLDQAACHPNPLVRALLAKKTGSKTWSLRARLVNDSDPRVRVALCRGLPQENLFQTGEQTEDARKVVEIVKETYPKDPCAKVRSAAKKHPL